MDSRIYTRGASEHAPTTAGLLVAEEPKCGPEPGRNHTCIVCHKQIAQNETWRKIWSADQSYAVAVHNACRGVKR